MQTLNIAQNETTFFVSIDKEKVHGNKLILIEKFLRSITNENYHVGYVDDDEQAEIEKILDNMTEDDKKIVKSKKVTITL